MTAFWSALVNGAILSGALAAAVGFVFFVTPRRALNAATRYAIWWVVLAATLLLPLSYVSWRVASPVSAAVALDQLNTAVEVAPTAAVAAAPRRISLPIEIPALPWMKSMLLVWTGVSALLLVRLLLSYIVLYRRTVQAGDAPPEWDERVRGWMAASGRRVRFALSAEIAIPAASGPARPAILIPSRLFEELSDGDLEQIARHEAAHLARWDDCALLVQRVIEACLALHPVVRWVTRQIDLEREIACDDLVAESTEAARSYADCLTRTLVLCGGVRNSLATANVADSRSHFSRRVELLMDGSRGARARLLGGRCAAFAVALIGVAALLSRTPELFAFSVPLGVIPAHATGITDTPLVVPERSLLAQARPVAVPPVAVVATTHFGQQRELGLQQIEDKHFDDAIATLRGILPEAMDDGVRGDIWSKIGEAYRYKGDLGGSIQAMEQAVILLPNSGPAVTNLALLYEAIGDKVRARQYYERAIVIDPKNPMVLNNLAYILTETNGDLDRALSYAKKSQAALPNFLEVRDTIAWIYLKKNMTGEAVAGWRGLVDAAPSNPVYHYHYAMALSQQGKNADALTQCMAAFSALAAVPNPSLAGDLRALMQKLQ